MATTISKAPWVIDANDEDSPAITKIGSDERISAEEAESRKDARRRERSARDKCARPLPSPQQRLRPSNNSFAKKSSSLRLRPGAGGCPSLVVARRTIRGWNSLSKSRPA